MILNLKILNYEEVCYEIENFVREKGTNATLKCSTTVGENLTNLIC